MGTEETNQTSAGEFWQLDGAYLFAWCFRSLAVLAAGICIRTQISVQVNLSVRTTKSDASQIFSRHFWYPCQSKALVLPAPVEDNAKEKVCLLGNVVVVVVAGGVVVGGGGGFAVDLVHPVPCFTLSRARFFPGSRLQR